MKTIDLTKFGLNETEEAIYIASLRIGSSSVQVLAKEAGVKRTTAYFAIDSLIEKGYLHQKISGKKKIVASVDPEYLRKVYKREMDALQERKSAVESIVPQLKAIMKETPDQSNVSFYEGKENLWHVFDSILKEREDIFWFGNFSSALKKLDFQELMERFSKKRRQIGPTKSFIISDPHPFAQKLWHLEDTAFREFRFLPKEAGMDSAIIIYGDKVALVSFEKNITVTVVQSKSVSGMIKVMFKIIWEASSEKPSV